MDFDTSNNAAQDQCSRVPSKRQGRNRAWAGLIAAAALGTALAFACGSVGAAAAQSSQKASRFYEDAQARFERDDIAGAVVQLKNALQQDPKMLAAYVLLGKAHLARGAAADAEDAFSKALKLGVDRSEIAVPMAQALYDLGKYQELLERFPAEIVVRPRQPELFVLRGHAYKAIDDPESALRAFE